MNETFRPRPWVLLLGIGIALLSTAAVAFCTSMFFVENPAEHGFHSERSMITGIVLFSLLLLFGIYLMVGYKVERLTISGTRITLRSVFQNRQFDLGELQSVQWSAHPSLGRITFRGASGVTKLDMAGYSQSDRARIIAALRESTPEHVKRVGRRMKTGG